MAGQPYNLLCQYINTCNLGCLAKIFQNKFSSTNEILAFNLLLKGVKNVGLKDELHWVQFVSDNSNTKQLGNWTHSAASHGKIKREIVSILFESLFFVQLHLFVVPVLCQLTPEFNFLLRLIF